MGECLDHLTVTGTRLLERIEPAIEKGRAAGKRSDGPFRYGPMQCWFIRTLGEDASKKIKTFPIYEPSSATTSKAQVATEFSGFHQRLATAIRTANGLDLKKVKVRSPAMPLLNLSVGAWFAATLAHERRHLAQAKRMLRQWKEWNGE